MRSGWKVWIISEDLCSPECTTETFNSDLREKSEETGPIRCKRFRREHKPRSINHFTSFSFLPPELLGKHVVLLIILYTGDILKAGNKYLSLF